jgi:hypothetical protein
MADAARRLRVDFQLCESPSTAKAWTASRQKLTLPECGKAKAVLPPLSRKALTAEWHFP